MLDPFTRNQLDYIDRQLAQYFLPHSKAHSISYRDAKKMIDYVSSPVSIPNEPNGIDLSAPKVQGGGGRRPTESEYDAIIAKAEQKADQNEEWRQLIREFLVRIQGDKTAEQMIKFTYKDKLLDYEISEHMNISLRTFYSYKKSVLEKVGTLAVQEGLMSV